MPRLVSTVHGLRDPETHRSVSFLAGEDVPEWVREQVPNPAAWDETVAEASAAGYPVDGTVREIEDWVGDNPDRAREALAIEEDRDKPRSTLVESLRNVIED